MPKKSQKNAQYVKKYAKIIKKYAKIISAHHVMTNIGMGIIRAAGSKYLRKQIAATAIKYNSQIAGLHYNTKKSQSAT